MLGVLKGMIEPRYWSVITSGLEIFIGGPTVGEFPVVVEPREARPEGLVIMVDLVVLVALEVVPQVMVADRFHPLDLAMSMAAENLRFYLLLAKASLMRSLQIR